MTLPIPPLTGSEEIDNALSYVADTGRTSVWTVTGHIRLIGSAWYQTHTLTGGFSTSASLGPFVIYSNTTHVPGGNPYAKIFLGGLTSPYSITVQLGAVAQTYRQAQYHKYPTPGNPTVPTYTFHDSDTDDGTLPDEGSGLNVVFPAEYKSDAASSFLPGIAQQFDGTYLGVPIYQSGAAVPVASASPFDPVSYPVLTAAIGPQFLLTGPGGLSAYSTVDNSATILSTYPGFYPGAVGGGGSQALSLRVYSGYLINDTFGSTTPVSVTDAWTNDLSIAEVDTDFTITITVKEQVVSSGLSAATNQWVPTHINCTAGASVLDIAIPTASQTAIDSWITVQPGMYQSANSVGNNISAWGASSDGFEATVTNWHLSGTNAGNDFTAIGGPVPITAGENKLKAIIDARKLSVVIDSTFGNHPVSTTSTDPGYNWYPANGGTTTGVISGSFYGAIAPTCGQTISFTELWWDGSPFNRKSTDAETAAIAAGIAAYADNVAGWGSNVPGAPSGKSLGPSGYAVIPYPFTSLTFKPQSILSSAYNAQYNNFAKWYVYGGSDPFYTANIGRKLGTLDLSVGSLPDLSSVSLSVASDAMGGSNTDTDTADLGNWAAARYLQMAVTGALTAGTAKLTITTADGHSADYTLKIASGAATVDLACPDSTSAFSFGVGIGLSLPVPAYVSTGATGPPWYQRSSTDTPTPAANSHVASIELTLSAPSQTLTVDSFELVAAIGYDAWTDPKGDGQGYAYEIAQVIAHHVPVHVPWFGHLDVLVDGKLALRYPNYGQLPNVSGYHDYNSGYQDHWDIATMLDDLIYDLGVLATGLTATWTQTFTPPGASIALSSRNIPVGLVTAPDVPLGQDDVYNTWASGATSLDIRRELTQITTPPFCCVYHLEGRWLHGGGLEGLAVDYATRQRLASASLSITHDPGVISQPPITGFPAIVTHASNAPTGTQTAATDTNGFFRSIFYEHYETPTVTRQTNGPLPTPPNEPLIYDGSGHLRSGAIGELTYNHVILLITTMVPRVSSLAPRDGSFHVAGTRFISGAPAGIAYWRCDTGCPRPGGVWDSTAVVITSNVLDGNPCLAQDYRGRLYCQFERSGGGIFEAFSDDDGQTWSAPIMGSITNGTYPYIRSGHDGSIFRAAYVDDGTGAGTGTIVGQWQAAGDPSPSTPVTFKDATGTAIPSQMGAFALDHIAETAGRWILTVLKPGDTTPTEYVSADDAGGTFVLVT